MTEATALESGSQPRWTLLHPTFALARGAGLTAVWLALVPFFIELVVHGRAWLLLLLLVLILLALANFLVGLLEGLLALWSAWPRLGSRGESVAPSLYPGVAVLPLLCLLLSWWMRLPERAFLAQNREALERAVETGEPTEAWEVWKEGECTFVRIGSWGIDGCFLIHDPRPEPRRGKPGEHDSFLEAFSSGAVRVKGEWFVLRT
ncbi:MAG: hypothetical protein NTV21_09775 [Planctomycetota bacterium]|nr:hypothetical protein [Planctomycetota bacterium]